MVAHLHHTFALWLRTPGDTCWRCVSASGSLPDAARWYRSDFCWPSSQCWPHCWWFPTRWSFPGELKIGKSIFNDWIWIRSPPTHPVCLPLLSSTSRSNPAGRSLTESSINWPSWNSATLRIRLSLATASWGWPADTVVAIRLLRFCRMSLYRSTSRSMSCRPSAFFSALLDLKGDDADEAGMGKRKRAKQNKH